MNKIMLASLVLLVSAQVSGASQGKPASSDPACCSVYELRQYNMKPGGRDVLIELFEREFVEPQEALGMRIAGLFRDPDQPDHFVWVRGFPNMEMRPVALNAMYTGPVWKKHNAAANATMLDVNNVLLLRSVNPPHGFALPGKRPPVGATELPSSLVVATICSLKTDDPEFPRLFERDIQPGLIAAGAKPIATFVTETAANNFPALPVREGEHVFVWFTRFENAAAHQALMQSSQWAKVLSALDGRLAAAPQQLRLQPTPRSELR